MASHKARKYYEMGIALNDAWLDFAPAKLLTKFEALPRSLELLAGGQNPPNGLSFLRNIPKALQAKQEKTDLQDVMKDHLIENLFNEQLIAVAYRESPSISRAPVSIDPKYFDLGYPDWKNETLDICGIRYGSIRIANPFSPEFTIPTTVHTGSKLAIRNAIALLYEGNANFGNLQRKIACQQVRDLLKSEYKPGNGLSDQNISKAIVLYCGQKRISI